ncbi:CapA family protein [Treponema pectinovorum]|uniref:CapA family protein n=1 Tax=Treponema pectinovorum TaxID=164 RepID=UPI0011CB247A|nr:CapA family protein [Treponema pectinovorum]
MNCFYYTLSMIFTRSCAPKFFTSTAKSLVLIILLFSCSSTKQKIVDETQQEQAANEKITTQINLTFAGDIMAHPVNFRQKDFSKIWQDLKSVLQGEDLCFANIEAPVCDSLEWSGYPQFNMHSTYVKAAKDVGFNVFSLANNHSNDWYLEGINETRTFFERFEKTDGIYACGLRKKNDSKITHRIIEKNGWKILFVAFTEILNRPDAANFVDYFPQKKQKELIGTLKKLREQNEADLFIVSVHTDEEEYKKQVTQSHRIFFKTLVKECKADVIWANHPHVTKEFETIEVFDDETSRKAFIMYGNGNTISGQRTRPSLQKNPDERDDTGDGLLIKVKFQKETLLNLKRDDAKNKKTKNKITLTKIEPHLITTYITPDGQFVVRLADEDFIHCLERSALLLWANYIKSRIKIYEDLKGISKWQ